jgi:hypothetical protein
MKNILLSLDEKLHDDIKKIVGNGSVNKFIREAAQERLKGEKNGARKLDKEWNSIYENTKEERFVELRNDNVRLQNSINLVFEELSKQNEALLLIMRRTCIVANLTGEMSEQVLPNKNGRAIAKNAVEQAESDSKKISLTLKENYDE